MGTVSHVLNHPDRVSAATVERVRAVIDELGFVRDSNAMVLARGRSSSVGLVVIDLGNSMFVDVARGAHRSALSRGLNVLVAGCEDAFDVQARVVDSFNEARVAGVLLAPMQDSSDQVKRLRASNRPTVLVNYSVPTSQGCSAIVDNERAGALAARHLLDIGCKRIVHVYGRDSLQPVRHRRSGVRQALAEAPEDVSYEELELDDLAPQSGADAARRLAGRGSRTRPDGIIATTDLLASSMLNELTSAGLRIPEDVAVMGCDDNTSGQESPLTLTSVRMMGTDLGAAGMSLLLEELDSPEGHVHRQIVLEPELVVRQSTRRSQR